MRLGTKAEPSIPRINSRDKELIGRLIGEIEKELPDNWAFSGFMRRMDAGYRSVNDDSPAYVSIATQESGLSLGAVPEVKGGGNTISESLGDLLDELRLLKLRG
jgi:hypothetical protein